VTRVTAPVLCGAYPRNSDPRSFLTHRAELTAESGWPVALCRRVARTGSITDDTTQHTDERPTCPSCARIYDKEAR
jgi:hypothetical protein